MSHDENARRGSELHDALAKALEGNEAIPLPGGGLSLKNPIECPGCHRMAMIVSLATGRTTCLDCAEKPPALETLPQRWERLSANPKAGTAYAEIVEHVRKTRAALVSKAVDRLIAAGLKVEDLWCMNCGARVDAERRCKTPDCKGNGP